MPVALGLLVLLAALAELAALAISAAEEPLNVTACRLKAETRSANRLPPPLTAVVLAELPASALAAVACRVRRVVRAEIWFAHMLALLIDIADIRVPSIEIGIGLPWGNRLPANTCLWTHRGALVTACLRRTHHSLAPVSPFGACRPAIPMYRRSG